MTIGQQLTQNNFTQAVELKNKLYKEKLEADYEASFYEAFTGLVEPKITEVSKSLDIPTNNISMFDFMVDSSEEVSIKNKVQQAKVIQLPVLEPIKEFPQETKESLIVTSRLPQLKLYYLSGGCGCGKTYQIIDYIASSKNQHFFYAASSIKLCDEIAERMITKGIKNVWVINSNNTANVSSTVVATIKELNLLDSGVILYCHQSMVNIPYFNQAFKWVCIIDELPSIENYYAINKNESYADITRFLEKRNETTLNLYQLQVKKPARLKEFLDSTASMDDRYQSLRPMLDGILHGQICYADAASWEKIIIRNEISKTKITSYMPLGDQANTLYFSNMQSPSFLQKFKKVIMMGANFTQSVLYKYWEEKCNVKWVEATKIQKKLRTIDLTDRVEIRYFQEKNWSLHCGKDGRLNDFITKTNEFFKGKDFLIVANKKANLSGSNGLAIDIDNRGSNNYSEYKNIAFLPAINRNPKQITMLAELNIDATYQQRALMHEVALQSFFRTDARNVGSNSKITCLVIDKATAESLARNIGKCSIGAMDGCLLKVKSISKTEESRNYRAKNLLKSGRNGQNSLFSVHFNPGFSTILNPEPLVSVECSKMQGRFLYIENTLQNTINKNNSYSEPLINLTVSEGIKVKEIIAIKDEKRSSLVKALKTLWTNTIVENKDDCRLFNGVTYKNEESRKLINSSYASFVMVDIDNGDLSKDDFIKIFKDRHSFLIFNTFSRSALKPNNYRVLFWITEKVTDEIYREIHLYIQNIVKNAGYITCPKAAEKKILEDNPSAKFSGIDLSKQYCSDLFYLPCRNVNNMDYAFFDRNRMINEAETTRYSIDPIKVIEMIKDKTELDTIEFEKPESTVNQESKITKEALLDELSTGKYYFGDHSNFGYLITAFKQAGLNINDLKQVAPFVSKTKHTELNLIDKMWKSWGKQVLINDNLGYLIKLMRNQGALI